LELTVYADILFVVNFTMDYLALYVTSFIMKLKFSVTRGIIAALFGGLYGVVSVALGLGGVINLVVTVISGAIMCLMVNGFLTLNMYLREMMVFLVSNLIIGGGMTALYAAFNSLGAAKHLLIYGEVESVEEQLPLALFAVGAFFITVILALFGRSFSKRKSVGTVDVTLKYGGRTVHISAIEDSGNLLTEPLSGQPIIIISRHKAESVLEARFIKLILDMKTDNAGYPIGRIRFLVCNTVTGKRTMGIFKPDNITVNGCAVSAWIAVAESDSFGELKTADGLVPSELINL